MTDASGIPAVAVVGLAGRWPGARDARELWENLRRGAEPISRLSPEEVRAAGGRPDDPRWVSAAGVLDGADRFDAAFFHITPREAERLDPQHRLFLECAWEALEDAGCDPGRFPGAIGVFGGSSLNTYLLQNLMPAGDSPADPQVAIASDKDFLTTRVSYKLNLTGPSLDVQTACSTSLVAVVLAVQSLLSYQCDLALAGGVSAREPQRAGYLYQEQGILSPDGHCRPFDAAARGTVPGNGVGIVALRRLEDALADGDPIRAVILGSALNNDGSGKVGYTAPGVSGQAEVVATALAVAGVDPGEIGFLEAHGTATPIGDPIEVQALHRVFGGLPRGSCRLGSVKSNFGHLDAAAGVTGLIKAVLALEHREIPPTLHFERPNPEIDWDAGPFRVNARLEPWESAGPRRAGVSSFGIGGTNAHVVLEEAPSREESPEAEGPELLILSARTETALEAMTERLKAHPDLHPADVARTLRLGRRPMEVRRFLLGDRTFTGTPPKGDREAVFLFPGQGAQHAGMVAGLTERESAFREALDECRAVLEPLGIDLPGLLETDLAETAEAQPALFALEYALARLWISRGVKPAAVLGHSLGEYVAACVAGVFSLPDALRLVVRRGRLMQSAPEGAMLAVPLPESEVELDGEVEIAAVNAPDRCVLTGPPEAIERLRQGLASRGIDAKPLAVRRAFHSRSLEPVLEDFVAEVRRARPRAPEIPWLSNLTGTWMTPEQATDPEAWGAALRRPVRFAPAVAELLRDPRRVLLEVGPGRTLSSLVRRQKGEAIPSLPSDLSPREGLLEALGRLWLAGVEIDWSAVGTPGPRVSLPTYPFERKRFWVEPAKPALAAPVWQESPRAVAGDLRSEKTAWLAISEGETGSRIVQRLQAERLEPVVAVPGPGFSRLSAGAFTVDPRRAEDFAALLATMPDGPLRIVYAGETGFEVLAEALRGRSGVQVDAIVRGTVALGIAKAAGLPCRVLDVEPPPLAGTPEANRWADRVLAEIAAPFQPGTATAWWGGRRWREGPEETADRKGFDLDILVEPPTETPVAEATDPLVASHAARILRAAASGPETTVAELRERLQLIPKYEPLLDFLLRVARQDGLIEIAGERVRFLGEAPEPAEVRRGLAARFPGFSHLHDLIDHCARHYPAALSGEVSGISVLYPEGDARLFGKAEPNPAARLLQDILAKAARERPLRILEVGAGQGTLTAELLPALAGSEYWFTDLGRSFVLRAEQKAREEGQDFLRFGVLDITRDPIAQGFSPESFDAVVGSDVVHATPRLAETLANLRSLLTPGGLLGLVETVRSRRWGTFVWGLTDGWWSFEDSELRRDSPLLSPEAWEELLSRSGFERPRAFPAGESALLAALRPEEAAVPVQPSPAPAVLHDRPLLQNPYVAPSDETERAVAEIWSRAIGIERIGAHDNFLELGGDSLVGLQVVHAVQARFDLGGRTFSLYEHPTVAAIARFVEGSGGSAEGDPFELRSDRGELRRERSTRLKRIRS